jgi:hypothetical protein
MVQPNRGSDSQQGQQDPLRFGLPCTGGVFTRLTIVEWWIDTVKQWKRILKKRGKSRSSGRWWTQEMAQAKKFSKNGMIREYRSMDDHALSDQN